MPKKFLSNPQAGIAHLGLIIIILSSIVISTLLVQEKTNTRSQAACIEYDGEGNCTKEEFSCREGSFCEGTTIVHKTCGEDGTEYFSDPVESPECGGEPDPGSTPLQDLCFDETGEVTPCETEPEGILEKAWDTITDFNSEPPTICGTTAIGLGQTGILCPPTMPSLITPQSKGREIPDQKDLPYCNEDGAFQADCQPLPQELPICEFFRVFQGPCIYEPEEIPICNESGGFQIDGCLVNTSNLPICPKKGLSSNCIFIPKAPENEPQTRLKPECLDPKKFLDPECISTGPVTSSPDLPEYQQWAQLNNYILEGLALIKEGRYEEAMRYFDDKKVAGGFGMQLRTQYIMFRGTPDQQQIDDAIYDIANESSRGRSGGWNAPSPDAFSITGVYMLPNEQGEIMPMPQELSWNAALVASEEWIHVLQEKIKRPLARQPMPDLASEDEVLYIEQDVAIYMHSLGVPLTRQFIDRYGRRKAIQEWENRNWWDE